MPEISPFTNHNPFNEKGLAGVCMGGILPSASIDSKIHWISANVQMERFYH
jgi:hypothetical protein